MHLIIMPPNVIYLFNDIINTPPKALMIIHYYQIILFIIYYFIYLLSPPFTYIAPTYQTQYWKRGMLVFLNFNKRQARLSTLDVTHISNFLNIRSIGT